LKGKGERFEDVRRLRCKIKKMASTVKQITLTCDNGHSS
jgi:hypothetical protein